MTPLDLRGNVGAMKANRECEFGAPASGHGPPRWSLCGPWTVDTRVQLFTTVTTVTTVTTILNLFYAAPPLSPEPLSEGRPLVNVRLCSPIFAYVRLMADKCFGPRTSDRGPRASDNWTYPRPSILAGATRHSSPERVLVPPRRDADCPAFRVGEQIIAGKPFAPGLGNPIRHSLPFHLGAWNLVLLWGLDVGQPATFYVGLELRLRYFPRSRRQMGHQCDRRP